MQRRSRFGAQLRCAPCCSIAHVDTGDIRDTVADTMDYVE
jgi:hypothetical protein